MMRDFLAGCYVLIFMPCWIAFMVYVVVYYGLSVAEAIGLGTLNGVFIAAFKDLWQFYFRKKETG